MKENRLPDATRAWSQAHLSSNAIRKVQPLLVEASNRQFYRLHLGHGSVVLMCSPPQLEDNARFVELARVFRNHLLPVPEVHASNLEQGWFLLDDLGDTHLQDVYGSEAEETALLSAVTTLPKLARVQAQAIEPYTVERLQMELGIFTEWLVGKALGMTVDPAVWQRGFDRLIAATQEQPQACVHRDYHCRNLLWRDGELGIVDFQDALIGPCLYDLASLLRDCYHTFSERKIERWLGVFVAAEANLAGVPPATIKRWFDFTAIQRQLKAIGIFARLHLRDGKSSHLRHIVPVTDRLLALLQQYEALRDLEMQLYVCREKLDLLATHAGWQALRDGGA